MKNNILETLKTAYEAGHCDEKTYLEAVAMFENKQPFTFKNGITMFVDEDKVDKPETLSLADMVNELGDTK